MDFDLENPLTSLKEHQFDTIPDLFASETDHMPSRNLLKCLKTCDFYSSFRQEAISLVLQVKNHHFRTFTLLSFLVNCFCSVLILSYLDRHSILATSSLFLLTLPLITWIVSYPSKKFRYTTK